MLELSQIESFYPQPLKPFKRNILREYLQYKILEIIYTSPYAGKTVFMGGTALHIAHGLPRFSEDLDFDNRLLNKKSFASITELIRRRLELEGYQVEAQNSYKGAFRAYIKIADVLYDNKLSAHKAEKLMIQLDAEPQKFEYEPDSFILNRFDVFAKVAVVPLEILLSQKLFAILMRKRPMGRDFYDAIFLLGKTRPDMGYLRAKLKISDITQLKDKLSERCAGLDFKRMAKDVEQFLFNSEDAKKIPLFPELVKELS